MIPMKLVVSGPVGPSEDTGEIVVTALRRVLGAG